MWKRSFVATTVAIGGTVDDAFAALDGSSASGAASGAALDDLVARLRAPQRPARAAALAAAIGDIVVAVDQATLR